MQCTSVFVFVTLSLIAYLVHHIETLCTTFTQVNILAHSMGARILMATAPYLNELCEACDYISFGTDYQQSPDGRNLVCTIVYRYY
jgi:pimeloyl-ACP methyl ester carboxylesterase